MQRNSLFAILFVVTLFISAGLVCSCSTAENSDDTPTAVYTLQVNTSISSRAAFPSVDTTLTNFYAYITDSSNSAIIAKTTSTSTAPLSLTFTILPSTMQLFVYAYSTEALLTAATASSSPEDSAFASYTTSLASTDFTGTSKALATTLTPIKTTGTGSVSLAVSFPQTIYSGTNDETAISTVKYNLSSTTANDTATAGTYTVAAADITNGTVKTTFTFSSVSSGKYWLTLQFYSNGTTPFIKQMKLPVNVWQNLSTTTWQSEDGTTLSETLALTDADFSTHNMKPASISAKFVDSANAEQGTLSWYTTRENQIAADTSTAVDTFTADSTYYGTTVTTGGYHAKFTVVLSMQGQSFAVENTWNTYNASGTPATYTDSGIASSFTTTTETDLTYSGTVPLAFGTNTIKLTVTASDGSTKGIYTFIILNSFEYVSSSSSAPAGADGTCADTTNTLSPGTGTISTPLATVQQAVYNVIGENNALKAVVPTYTAPFTVFITGAITEAGTTTVNKSLDSYYSMVGIVSTANALNLTIAGTTGDSTSDGIDVSAYNTTATTKVRGLFVYENTTSASSAVLLTLKDIYIKGGSIAKNIEAANSPSGSAILARGGGALLCNTNVLLKNVIIGSTSTVSDAATETSCANYASEDGGGIAVVNGVASFDSSCIIRSNYSPATTNGYGGGGLSIWGGSKVTLDGTTVSYNSSKHGGGIYIYNGALSCSGSTKIQSNNATYGGGGLYIVLSGASATLSGTSEISSNTLALSGGTEFYGAGVYLKSGTLTMNGSSKISQNVLPSVTKSFGGGIYITDSDSLANSGTVTITSGTVSSNTGATAGGGIYIAGGTLSLSNAAVISGNALSSGNVNGPQVYIAGDKTNTSSVLISQPTCILTGGASIANSGTGYTHSVYLSTGKQIKLSGSVSAMASAIVLLPQSYPSATSAVQVLSADTAYTLTDTDVAKFSVAPEVVDASTSTTRTWLIADSTKSPLTPGTLYYDGTSTISIVNGIETMVFSNSSVSVKTGSTVTLEAPTIGGTTTAFDTNTVCYIDGVQLTGTANNDTTNTKYNGMMIAYATNNETATLTPPTKVGIYTVSLMVTKDGTDYSLTFTLTVTQ